MSKERPILFSNEMVRAILRGDKTQTRRVIKNVPEIMLIGKAIPSLIEAYKSAWIKTCPYGQVGDQLWIKEAWCRTGAGATLYRADDKREQPYWKLLKWKSARFMPRLASRIDLEITGVRVERLQDITEEDAKAEGIQPSGEHITLCPGRAYCNEFAVLWNTINAERGFGWTDNTYVWVITFRRIKP